MSTGVEKFPDEVWFCRIAISERPATGLLTSKSNQHKLPVTGAVVELVLLKNETPRHGAGSSTRLMQAVIQSVNVST